MGAQHTWVRSHVHATKRTVRCSRAAHTNNFRFLYNAVPIATSHDSYVSTMCPTTPRSSATQTKRAEVSAKTKPRSFARQSRSLTRSADSVDIQHPGTSPSQSFNDTNQYIRQGICVMIQKRQLARAYLLSIPSPSENEFASDVWNVDFINDRPHVARLMRTKHALAIALRAWHGELGAGCAGLRVADWLRLGFRGIGSVVSGICWLTRRGLVHSACFA